MNHLNPAHVALAFTIVALALALVAVLMAGTAKHHAKEALRRAEIADDKANVALARTDLLKGLVHQQLAFNQLVAENVAEQHVFNQFVVHDLTEIDAYFERQAQAADEAPDTVIATAYGLTGPLGTAYTIYANVENGISDEALGAALVRAVNDWEAGR